MADAAQPNLIGDQTALSWNFWSMLLFTGVASGLVGGLLMQLLYFTERHAFGYVQGGFLEGTMHASAARKLTVLLLAGALAGAGGLLAGRMKGNTDLSGAVWLHSGRLPVLKGLSKALYSIVVVGMGAAVGRENALKQAGGVLATLAASWRNLPDDQRRLLVACGGGAGMAAAYNVPLGGAVFTLEVLLGSFSLRAVLPAFATSMLAVWTSWLLLPDAPTYVIDAAPATLALVLFAAIAGPACGLVAVPFIRLLGWAKGHKPRGWQIAAYPVLSLGLLGVASAWVPELLGNGKDVIQLAFLDRSSTGLMLVLFVFRPLFTAVIFRSGVPGGLFTPTMSLGAVTGVLLGRGWEIVMPAAAAGNVPSCALIAAAALLAAANQAPVSSMIFVLELTRTADSVMVPLLIAVVTATLVVRHFEERSMYSIEVVQGDSAAG